MEAIDWIALCTLAIMTLNEPIVSMVAMGYRNSMLLADVRLERGKKFVYS